MVQYFLIRNPTQLMGLIGLASSAGALMSQHLVPTNPTVLIGLLNPNLNYLWIL
jgi:hypothetical protein